MVTKEGGQRGKPQGEPDGFFRRKDKKVCYNKTQSRRKAKLREFRRNGAIRSIIWEQSNCSEPLRFLNVTSEIPCRIALRRWDFLTLDLFSYGLSSKCLDLLNKERKGCGGCRHAAALFLRTASQETFLGSHARDSKWSVYPGGALCVRWTHV